VQCLNNIDLKNVILFAAIRKEKEKPKSLSELRKYSIGFLVKISKNLQSVRVLECFHIYLLWEAYIKPLDVHKALPAVEVNVS
jgi:hypothetical protein